MRRSDCPRFWQILFAGATALAVAIACLPHPPLPAYPPDEILHFFTFGALAVLAQTSFPHTRAWTILVGLGALGAGIELFQLISKLGRDASTGDWLADILGVLAGLVAARLICVFNIFRIKQQFGDEQSKTEKNR